MGKRQKEATIIRMFLKLLGSLLVTFALCTPGAASADGAVLSVTPDAVLTFAGQGAGHGVGMSQWGARGRALAGQSAADILAAYYQGTTLAQQGDDTETIRVLMPAGQVQTLTMRDYLASVVSSELPAGFPTAAVQAQAIASRTYARWEMNASRPYDVTSTVSTQAFGATARPDAIGAVQATEGVVLTYAGSIIPAYFFDCTTGMTENNENVWGGAPLPYLRSINDRDANGVSYAAGCPRQQWQAGPFTGADLSRILAEDARTNVGNVTALSFTSRSPAGRWLSVTIQGDSGSKNVTLSVFRIIMNAGAPVARTIFSADFSLTSSNQVPSRSLLENGVVPTNDLRSFSFVL
jgi:SpoIID/LytB domain protein